jgi:hypothetical protein
MLTVLYCAAAEVSTSLLPFLQKCRTTRRPQLPKHVAVNVMSKRMCIDLWCCTDSWITKLALMPIIVICKHSAKIFATDDCSFTFVKFSSDKSFYISYQFFLTWLWVCGLCSIQELGSLTNYAVWRVRAVYIPQYPSAAAYFSLSPTAVCVEIPTDTDCFAN